MSKLSFADPTCFYDILKLSRNVTHVHFYSYFMIKSSEIKSSKASEYLPVNIKFPVNKKCPPEFCDFTAIHSSVNQFVP